MEFHDNRGRGGRGRGKRGGKGSRGSRARGSSHSRGRGGFYPKKRGNSHNQNLDSNEWRFKNEYDESSIDSLRRETIENCSRQLIQSNAFSESRDFTNEEVQKIDEIISKLSIEEQINYDFIVPMPSLDTISTEKKQNVINDKELEKNDEHKEPEKKQEDLNDWLDNLIG